VTVTDAGGPDANDCASKVWIDPVFDCPLQGCQTGPNYHCM
jgi:hypothetical protein